MLDKGKNTMLFNKRKITKSKLNKSIKRRAWMITEFKVDHLNSIIKEKMIYIYICYPYNV